jgi:hypothetical protein
MTPPTVGLSPADARRERVTLGRANPGVIACTVSIIIGCFVFAWGWLAAPPDAFADVADTAPALSLVVFVNYLAASPRVRGDGAGLIRVDGLVLQRAVPIEEIAEVRSDAGLLLHLRSGRDIKSSAYPWTTSGRVVNFPRARRAASRIRDFIDRHPGQPDASVGVSVRPRTFDIAAGACLAATLLLGTVLINALWTRA